LGLAKDRPVLAIELGSGFRSRPRSAALGRIPFAREHALSRGMQAKLAFEIAADSSP